MREIKFRAFLKNEKKIVEVISLDILAEFITYYDDLAKEDLIVELSDCELMQYTGLKDKNGVEIYEGDVVKYPFPDYETGKSKVHTMQVKWIDGDACFSLVNDEWDILLDLPTQKYMEVIGNIHENPELLNKEED